MAEKGPVDMSNFLLHEAQAQLQLALLGVPEEIMEETNAGIRQTFMLSPDAKIGHLSEAMKGLMKLAREDASVALPSDGCPVRGPLSRALQTGHFASSTDYGMLGCYFCIVRDRDESGPRNLLLILFAGHDTTGHTMTWLLFELARHPEIQQQDLSGFDLLDRCITETLRLWPAVANGTFRQLQFGEDLKGVGGQVQLPKGTFVTVTNWCRHRNPELWGADADTFNPWRDFSQQENTLLRLPEFPLQKEPQAASPLQELVRVGCPMAARTPQSARFSPFAHNPRSCLGKNFAQMEMRLILSYILGQFSFSLAPPYDSLKDVELKVAETDSLKFRGINKGGTMGPMDLERGGSVCSGERFQIALKLHVQPRRA
eukprot:g27227.t1